MLIYIFFSITASETKHLVVFITDGKIKFKQGRLRSIEAKVKKRKEIDFD